MATVLVAAGLLFVAKGAAAGAVSTVAANVTMVAYRRVRIWHRVKNIDPDIDDEEISQTELDEIKSGMYDQNTAPLRLAYHLLDKAYRWQHDEKKWKDYIKRAYYKCEEASVQVEKPLDFIRLYSLDIACGFIYHSNYYTNYIDGLLHIYHVLQDMNKNKLLKKVLDKALITKQKKWCLDNQQKTWSKKDIKLIKSVLRFAVKTKAFIESIKNDLPDDYKQQTNNAVSNSMELHGKIMNYMVKQGVLLASMDDVLKIDWYPNYRNGYYFGEVKETAYKFNPLPIHDIRSVMGVIHDQYIQIDDIIIYTTSIFDTCQHVMDNTVIPEIKNDDGDDDVKKIYHYDYGEIHKPFKMKIQSDDKKDDVLYAMEGVTISDVKQEILKKQGKTVCSRNNLVMLQYITGKSLLEETTLNKCKQGSVLRYKTKERCSCVLFGCQ